MDPPSPASKRGRRQKRRGFALIRNSPRRDLPPGRRATASCRVPTLRSAAGGARRIVRSSRCAPGRADGPPGIRHRRSGHRPRAILPVPSARRFSGRRMRVTGSAIGRTFAATGSHAEFRLHPLPARPSRDFRALAHEARGEAGRRAGIDPLRGPASSIRPLFMTTIRLAKAMASSWSWVTWTKQRPVRRCRARSSSCIWRRRLRSRAPKGSSSRRISGSTMRARAKATRWRWPPESSCTPRAPKPASPTISRARSTR